MLWVILHIKNISYNFVKSTNVSECLLCSCQNAFHVFKVCFQGRYELYNNYNNYHTFY